MGTIQKYQAALRHRTNPRYMTKDFVVPLYTGTEPDILDDSNTQRESNVYKDFPNDMPIVSPKDIQNQNYKQLELADGGSVERRGFGKGSPPPGYITGKELEELTGIPNLSVQAKELMYAPKEYKRSKNLFGNFYKKELKAKYFDIGQGGKYGTLHYKKPTTEQIETMKAYHSRRGAKYGVTQGTADRMKLFHNDPKLRNYVRNGKIIPDELLKEYDITRNEAAQSTFRLAQAYNGKKFTNVDVGIPKNRKAGKKLFEEIDRAPFGNPYKMVSYKEALNTITEGIGDKYFEKKTFEDMKREARRILQKEKIPVFDPTIKGSKGININELTGITSSSRNKSFPYSQFINLMEGNLNTKNYARFNKEFEKYEKNLQNEITKGKQGNPNKIIKEYRNYSNNFIEGLDKADKAQIEKLGLPELSLKEPTELYGKKRIAQLLGQGLDLPSSYKDLGYSIKVPKGTATLKEFIINPEIRTQMIANIGCPTIGKSLGGRVSFSEGSNCYTKGLEKIKSGELSVAERTMAGNFLKEAGAGEEIVSGLLKGGKKGLGILEDVLGFGKGVVGRTITPLVAANSALEQFTSGNYAEGFRKIGDVADLTTLVGYTGLEELRRKGGEKDIKKIIGEKNYAGFDQTRLVANQYDQLEDVKQKLERVKNAAQYPDDPLSPGVDTNYINELEKQKSILEKNLNEVNEDEIRKNLLNQGKIIYNDILKRNPNAPKSSEYTYKTATLEQLERQYGPGFMDIYKDDLNKSFGPDLTILDKQQDNLFQEPVIQSSDDSMMQNQYNDGGRVGLAGGGPKMGRRGFLGLLTGVAAAPELMKALKGEKKAVQAAKLVSKIKLEKAEGMYPWFPDLIEKIKTKGKPFEEKEIIMEASYKHEAKGYGGLPQGVETVTRHVDGDTEFLLREYPDGRLAVDIHSPRNQEGSSTPVTLYYRPTMELKYYNGVQVEPAEFKVLEKEPRYFANGPDDVDIEMSEMRKVPGKNTIFGDVEAAERFATGKIENRKIIPAKQARREQMEDAPTDFIEETSNFGYYD